MWKAQKAKKNPLPRVRVHMVHPNLGHLVHVPCSYYWTKHTTKQHTDRSYTVHRTFRAFFKTPDRLRTMLRRKGVRQRGPLDCIQGAADIFLFKRQFASLLPILFHYVEQQTIQILQSNIGWFWSLCFIYFYRWPIWSLNEPTLPVATRARHIFHKGDTVKHVCLDQVIRFIRFHWYLYIVVVCFVFLFLVCI